MKIHSLMRGLLVAGAVSSLSGCIVITPAHRHYGGPRVAVDVHSHYPVPRDDRRDHDGRRYPDTGPRRW